MAAGRVVLTVGVLTGCSSVPDAINPVEWYKGASDLVSGRERPETAGAPRGEFPDVNKDAGKEPARALVADRGNAKYAEPVRREVAPTKPLVKRPTPPAETQVAAATKPAAPVAAPTPAAPTPVIPAAPAVAKADLPPTPAPVAASAPAAQTRLSPDRPQQPARSEGPDSPPQALNMTPPAPANISETVPTPGQPRLKPVQAQYQKRLAESAATVVRPDIVDGGAPTPRTVASLDDEPIHLVPPSSKRGSRAKGAAARDAETGPAASFQVASLDFQATSATLTKDDRAAIAEVARLYRQSRGGVVRVVGQAPAPAFAGDEVSRLMGGLDASVQRANAVARELTRQGVPASKILIAGDPGQGDGSGAKVYLDVI
ncbi:MAG: hypothetical protein ACM33T_10200 [Solirubrobacterales bacterium]